MSRRSSSRRVRRGRLGGSAPSSSAGGADSVDSADSADRVVGELAGALFVVALCEREEQAIEEQRRQLREDYEKRFRQLDAGQSETAVRKAKAIGMANGLYYASRWWEADKDFYEAVPGLREKVAALHEGGGRSIDEDDDLDDEDLTLTNES